METVDDVLSSDALLMQDYVCDQNLSSDNTPDNNAIQKTILSLYNNSHGGLGSDGSSGSTNGELKNASCVAIAAGLLELGSLDVVLDIGSGSGVTLTKMVANSKCKSGIGRQGSPLQ